MGGVMERSEKGDTVRERTIVIIASLSLPFRRRLQCVSG